MPFKRKEDNTEGDIDGSTKKSRTKANKEVIELCQQIFDEIKKYKNEENRIVSESLLHLPLKRASTNKQQQIDLSVIESKIKSEDYFKFEEFDDDITLMIANSKQHYKKSSQEYKDANDLWDFYHEKKKLLAEAFTQRKIDESNPLSAFVSRTTTRKRSLAATKKNRGSIDDDFEMEIETPVKKKGRKPKMKPIEPVDETESEDNETGSVEETVNLKKKRSIESNNSNENHETHNISDHLEDYFDVIASCQDGGRYISNIFHLLPSYKEYPDYYEIIKDPIDLKTIGNKIINLKYKNLDEMEHDLILMVNNAKRYNDPKSQLYKDAQYLKRIITSTRVELENAIKNNRSFGVKTREKKRAIVLEIAQLEGNDTNNNLNANEEEDDDLEEDDDDHDDEDDEDEEDDDESNESNNEIDDSNENVDDEYGNEDDAFWSLFTYIKNYRYGNQLLIDPFLKLPNKRVYPDYYEEIKKPIALNHIKNNIKKGKYSILKELLKDIELMFKNAMTYNREDSAIYINAKRLQNAALNKFNELEQKFQTNDSIGQRSILKSANKKNLLSNNKLQRLFKSITDYSESGRILSKSFLNLPQRDTQSDYYELIKDPIDLEQIRKNIDKNLYKNETEMLNDCMRVFENSKLYFKSGSQFYNDAQALENYLNKRYENFLTRNDTTFSNSMFNIPIIQITAPNPSYANLDLKEKMLIIYNYINDYKEQGTKRELADPFNHLPSKLEYPDYYNVIKKPIDLTKIYNKIINGSYITCEDMILDYAQCFENACIYNEPGSQIYKDALLLQKLVYFKRVEVDTNLNDDVYTICDVKAAVQDILLNLYDSTFNYQDIEGRKLSDSFLELFNSNINSSDLLKDEKLYTFQSIKQNLLSHLYKRLDAFQDDMFKMFDQIRRIFDKKSQVYKDSIDLQIFFINKRDELCKKGEVLSSNAFSYKVSSFEEDELYIADTNINEENVLNEILQINYLNKLKESLTNELNLEQHQSILFGDDNFKLNCNDFVYLKKFQQNFTQDHLKNETVYNDENIIACVLAIYCEKGSNEPIESDDEMLKPLIDDKKYKLLVQLYLKPNDINGHKHKYIQNELFKSDIYEIINLDQLIHDKCYIISLKDYINYTIDCDDKKCLQKMYLCESIYCTRDKLFRKIKKWQTNISNSSYASSLTKLNSLNYELDKFKFTLRQCPLVITRNFLNSNEINDIKFDNKQETTTIIEKQKSNILLTQSQATAIQENESYIYYEQIVYKNECYKMGDYLYIKQKLNEKNELVSALLTQLPVDVEDVNKGTIIRIERLWRIRAQNDKIQQNQIVDNNDYNNTDTMFYIKGPIFLRSIDIHHEPTRLFYKNEVFKDNSREFTTKLNEICGRCVVLSMKNYVNSRPTEIDENDVYICENKYVCEQKTCRKFTKGLKQFELSHKCYEDEIYFFKKEIRLRKYLSPILLNDKLLIFTINNAVKMNSMNSKSLDLHHLDDDTNSNSMISNDYLHNANQNHNNTTVFGGVNDMNTSTCSSNLATPSKSKKEYLNSLLNSSRPIDPEKLGSHYKINKSGKLVRKRVKRSKKCGYNIFSKEFRKKLRDEQSTLTFIEMSREVGNHWRLLTDGERAKYEERAKEESIKEAARMAETAAAKDKANEAKLKQHQQQQQQQQSQQQYIHNIPSNGQHINQIFANQNNILKPNQQQSSAQINATLTANNGSQYSIINVTPSNAVQLNLNYGQNTAYIIKQPNQAIQMDQNSTLQFNEYIQRTNQEQLLQQQQQQQNKAPFVNYQTKPLKPQHTEAYMRYIERLKKSQETNQRYQYLSYNDWQSYLDIRPPNMRETNMTAAPTNWIENVTNGDVFRHLVSLRYYLINDSINIKHHELYEDVNDKDVDKNHENCDVEMEQDTEPTVINE